jgi:uncharacterized protein
VILVWVDNSNNELSFSVERCLGAGCANFSQIGTVGANVTTTRSLGLSRSTTYGFRVRAVNASGNSAYSNVLTVTTPR